MIQVYSSMEAGVHTSSSGVSTPTLTPTMVRSRPKLPPIAGTCPHPGGIKKTTSDPSTSQEVEDLVSVLYSLGNTDYIGKYSRKRRTSSGVSSPTPSVSSVSLPMSPMSPVTSPGSQTPPFEGRAVGTITLTRMHSIKLKLEKVKQSQDREFGDGGHIPRRRTGCVEAPQTRVSITMEHQHPVEKLEVIESSVIHRDNSQSPKARTLPSQTLMMGANSSVLGSHPCSPVQTGVSSSGSHTMTTTHPSSADNGMSWSTSTAPIPNINSGLTTCAHADSAGTSHPMYVGTEMETCLQVTEEGDLPMLGVAEPLRVTEHHDEDEGVGDIEGSHYKDTLASSLAITEESKSILKRTSSKELGDGSESRTSSTGSLRDASSKASVTFTDEQNAASAKCLQRLVQPGSSGNGKMANGRFLTHPPVSERTTSKEAGSVDSNGLGSLREGMETLQASGELSSQVSLVSVDSHMSPSETSEPPTYRDVVLSVTAEGTDMDKMERRNGKSLKQKSKSDPSGDKKQKDSSSEFSDAVMSCHTQAQSTPMLSKEKEHVPQLPEFAKSEKERRKSKSDNILSSAGKDCLSSIEEKELIVQEIPMPDDFLEEAQQLAKHAKLRRSQKKRQRMALMEAEAKAAQEAKKESKPEKRLGHRIAVFEPELKLTKEQKQKEMSMSPEKDEEGDGEEKDLIAAIPTPLSPRSKRLARKPRSYTAPATPETRSQDIPMDRGSALTIPLSKKASALARSHSAASFLQLKDKSQGQGVRPKELPDKSRQGRLIVTDTIGFKRTEDVHTDLHSPRLRDKQGIRTYSPRLEPIFSGSSLSLFEGNDADKVGTLNIIVSS